MKKEKASKSEVARIKSMIGEKAFNKEMQIEILKGTPVEEAPELIARRKMRLGQ
jgi:hypothetical protein